MNIQFPSCGGVFPPCLAEIHAMQVGLFAAVLIYLLKRRSPIAAALPLTALLVLALTQSVDGLQKPWYVLFGALVGLLLARGVVSAYQRVSD